MSAIYMSHQLSTALTLMEGDHHHLDHHHQGHFQAFTLPKDPPILFPFVISNSSASESSLSYASPADHNHLLRQHRQAMLESQHTMIGGSSSAATASSVFATPFPTVESIRDDMIEPAASYDPYDMGKLQLHQVVGGGSSMDACGSWTPPAAAKMRITRKQATADPTSGAGAAGKKPRRRAHQAAGYDADINMRGQPNLGVIRVCSDCNTTKTPLWRSGPCGPKSLCNACGIRQRKARRAMMAAGAASGSGPAVPTNSGKATSPSNTGAAAAAAAHLKVKKEKRSVDMDRSLPFKKRCKVVQIQQDHHAAAAVAAAPVASATDRAAAVVVQATGAAEVGDDDACLPSRDLLVDDIGGLISWSRSPAAAPASAAASCSFRASPALAPVVQQDEITDAAMLLMTLSCGLIRS